jgi:hypothetical protein
MIFTNIKTAKIGPQVAADDNKNIHNKFLKNLLYKPRSKGLSLIILYLCSQIQHWPQVKPQN